MPPLLPEHYKATLSGIQSTRKAPRQSQRVEEGWVPVPAAAWDSGTRLRDSCPPCRCLLAPRATSVQPLLDQAQPASPPHSTAGAGLTNTS